MKLIVGLGNPGRRYEQSRHNIGFLVAAEVTRQIGADRIKSRFDGEVAEGLAGEKLVILCPQTYMNASGKSVRKACDFYKLTSEDVLVICDDLNLPTGRLRFRANGSAGGQKGLADIIRHLGTDQISRLRIGIDRPPPGWDAADYVLGKFDKSEEETIERATSLAAKAVVDWSREGIGFVMNRYNPDPAAAKKQKKTKQKDQASQRPGLNVLETGSTMPQSNTTDRETTGDSQDLSTTND